MLVSSGASTSGSGGSILALATAAMLTITAGKSYDTNELVGVVVEVTGGACVQTDWWINHVDDRSRVDDDGR